MISQRTLKYFSWLSVINEGCQTYNEHSNKQVFLGDLSMGEDVVEHIGHITFVFLPECEHTLVIMSC